jgi:ligand-binding sensor domain-containing protein
VLGPSDLPKETGPVVTAEQTSNFWFVRQQGGGFGVFGYDPTKRSIVRHDRGLNPELVPRQLRAAGSLYLWGSQSGRGTVYVNRSGDGWEQLAPADADIVQILAASHTLFRRAASGAIHVYPDRGMETTLVAGRAPAVWRRLAADRFGRLWAVADDGAAWVYSLATGCWSMPSLKGKAADVLVVTADNTSDRIYFATTQGLQVRTATAAEVKEGEQVLAEFALAQIEQDGNRLWALAVAAGDPPRREVWAGEPSGKDWHKVWETATPALLQPADDPARAIWATFVEDELWFVTEGGTLWRYGLRNPVWHSWPLGSLGRDENNRPLLQVTAAGVLWWVDEKKTLQIATRQHIETGKPEGRDSFNGLPSYRSPWEAATGFCSAGIVIAIVAAGVCWFGPPFALILIFVVNWFAEWIFGGDSGEQWQPPWGWCFLAGGMAVVVAFVLWILAGAIDEAYVAPCRPFRANNSPARCWISRCKDKNSRSAPAKGCGGGIVRRTR